MSYIYNINYNPFDDIKFIPSHNGIQSQFIVRRYKNNNKYTCNFHMHPDRETKQELIGSGMNYLFNIPIGKYDVTLTGTNDQNFQLKFTAIDISQMMDQLHINSGGNPIKSSDINFSIP